MAGAGAEIMDKGGAGAENKKFRRRSSGKKDVLLKAICYKLLIF